MNVTCEKAMFKKFGLFKINFILHDTIMKQLEVINFASLTDKSPKIPQNRVVSQLERKYMAQKHATGQVKEFFFQ